MIARPIVIARHKLPVLTEMDVGGKMHFLGEYRDFRNQENLKEFLDGETDISMSWTHLKDGEQHDVHTHDVKSMVIISSGHGVLLGDIETDLTQGDIIIIPAKTNHGFRGKQDGFHALSIQFEKKSLFARDHTPDVAFQHNELENKKVFLKYNDKRIQKHCALPIFQIIRDGTVKNKIYMDRMLSFLSTWSSYFQKLVMLRGVTSSTNKFGPIAKEHLIEEFGHDSLLKESPINDPVVTSISTWFVHQMLCRTDLEKHIIVHSVLENGAHSFHGACVKYLSGTADSYFNVHVEHDENHAEMGLDMILDNFNSQKDIILKTLDEAWDMLDLLFIRAYEIITKEL